MMKSNDHLVAHQMEYQALFPPHSEDDYGASVEGKEAREAAGRIYSLWSMPPHVAACQEK